MLHYRAFFHDFYVLTDLSSLMAWDTWVVSLWGQSAKVDVKGQQLPAPRVLQQTSSGLKYQSSRRSTCFKLYCLMRNDYSKLMPLKTENIPHAAAFVCLFYVAEAFGFPSKSTSRLEKSCPLPVWINIGLVSIWGSTLTKLTPQRKKHSSSCAAS